MLHCSISVTIDLEEYDLAVEKYCKESSDDKDYTDLLNSIQDDLEQLDGCVRVVFDHMSWMEISLGTDDFKLAEKELEQVKGEIIQCFEKHGIRV